MLSCNRVICPLFNRRKLRKQMAGRVERSPFSVGTSDSLTKAMVTLEVPELRVGILGRYWHGQPQNAESEIYFYPRSVHFQLEITSNKRIINYTHTVKRLPGEIKPDDCYKKFYNGKVVLALVKAKEESWEATLASTGLDLE